MALEECDGETSLEERIVRYPVVIRAVVDSVTSDIIAPSGFETGKYAVVLKFNLTVREYLNGSGINCVTGIWPAFPSYDSRAEAEAEQASLVAGRSAPYDDREAIFFLTDDFWIYDAADDDAAAAYYLDSAMGLAGSSWNGAIDVRAILNRLWLPTNNIGAGDSREYLLALPGSNLAGFEQATVSSASTITLAAVKGRIAAVNTKLNNLCGTAERRRQCLENMYKLQRLRHHKRVEFGHEPLKARDTEHSIASGAPTGTVIFEQWGLAPSSNEKPTTAWIEGEASSLFELADGDSLPGDQNSLISGPKGSIVYPQQLTNARPLPAGSYSITVKERFRSPVANCFGVESFDWTVTVTATSPAGVLHEFFFDPVAIGSSAGADATNGVLKPAIFTNANGASTTIESITYEAGRVKVKVVPWTAMRQHTLDIINQDGTLLAPLTLQNSAVETHTNTLIWKVTPQPWMDGDKLMGHIRSAAPFASSPNGASATAEGEDSIRLAWNSASGVTGHVVQRSASAEDSWETLDASVTDRSYTATGLSRETTYRFRVGAYGDGTRYERVTGSTSHATVSGTTGNCSQASPVFASASYSFSVVEHAAVGATVGAVSATDPEDDTVRYSITSGNETGTFAIGGSSGRINQHAKGEVGLDDYEGRLWSGFHRHVALCMLAHCYRALRQNYGSIITYHLQGDRTEEHIAEQVPWPTRGFPSEGRLSVASIRRLVLERLFAPVIEDFMRARVHSPWYDQVVPESVSGNQTAIDKVRPFAKESHR